MDLLQPAQWTQLQETFQWPMLVAMAAQILHVKVGINILASIFVIKDEMCIIHFIHWVLPKLFDDCLSLAVQYMIDIVMARQKHKIYAPAVSGHPDFDRVFRVQANFIEQYVSAKAVVVSSRYVSATDNVSECAGHIACWSLIMVKHCGLCAQEPFILVVTPLWKAIASINHSSYSDDPLSSNRVPAAWFRRRHVPLCALLQWRSSSHRRCCVGGLPRAALREISPQATCT